MNISSIQSPVDVSSVPLKDLAGNKSLTEQQKLAEASRQFEAILLRQFLSESQKPVITSEFTDNSTAAGIYQDYITNTLADSISKSGTLGFAKIFERQLSHSTGKVDAKKNADSSAAQKIDSSLATKPKALSTLNFDHKTAGQIRPYVHE